MTCYDFPFFCFTFQLCPTTKMQFSTVTFFHHGCFWWLQATNLYPNRWWFSLILEIDTPDRQPKEEWLLCFSGVGDRQCTLRTSQGWDESTCGWTVDRKASMSTAGCSPSFTFLIPKKSATNHERWLVFFFIIEPLLKMGSSLASQIQRELHVASSDPSSASGLWHDPHNNGTYSLTSDQDILDFQRVTGNKKCLLRAWIFWNCTRHPSDSLEGFLENWESKVNCLGHWKPRKTSGFGHLQNPTVVSFHFWCPLLKHARSWVKLALFDQGTPTSFVLSSKTLVTNVRSLAAVQVKSSPLQTSPPTTATCACSWLKLAGGEYRCFLYRDLPQLTLC